MRSSSARLSRNAPPKDVPAAVETASTFVPSKLSDDLMCRSEDWQINSGSTTLSVRRSRSTDELFMERNGLPPFVVPQVRICAGVAPGRGGQAGSPDACPDRPLPMRKLQAALRNRILRNLFSRGRHRLPKHQPPSKLPWDTALSSPRLEPLAFF